MVCRARVAPQSASSLPPRSLAPQIREASEPRRIRMFEPPRTSKHVKYVQMSLPEPPGHVKHVQMSLPEPPGHVKHVQMSHSAPPPPSPPPLISTQKHLTSAPRHPICSQNLPRLSRAPRTPSHDSSYSPAHHALHPTRARRHRGSR